MRKSKIYLGPALNQPQPKPEKPARQCMVPGCPQTVIYARRLCRPCYHYAASLIAKNLTTWEELEAKGLVHYATRPQGYPKRDWRAAHFKEFAPPDTRFAKRADPAETEPPNMSGPNDVSEPVDVSEPDQGSEPLPPSDPGKTSEEGERDA